jgi:hypothetical protein
MGSKSPKYYGIVVYQQDGCPVCRRITRSEVEHHDLLLKLIFTEGFNLIKEKILPT